MPELGAIGISVFALLGMVLLAVPGARMLGLGAIPGYLLAGVVIGPWGLAFIHDAAESRSLSTVALHLMLFLIGFRLRPQHLWQERQVLFRFGVLQWAVSALLLCLIGLAIGVEWYSAVAAAMILSLSSHALADHLLLRQNLKATSLGAAAEAIVLAQCLAFLLLLLVIPLLGFGSPVYANTGWIGLVKHVLVLVAVATIGRYLLRHSLRYITALQATDMFIAMAIFAVLAVTLLLQSSGASTMLGVFVAGVLLSDSDFHQELGSALEPYAKLVVGLFFVTVGLTVDFGLVLQKPAETFGLLLVLMLVKALVLIGVARLATVAPHQQALFAVLFCQGGELAFAGVVAASHYQAINASDAAMLVVVLTLSLLLTPLLQILLQQREKRLLRAAHNSTSLPEPEPAPIAIAGFGRVGQVVGRLMTTAGVATTIIDHEPLKLHNLGRYGFRVVIGDARRDDIQARAGLQHARVLVVAVDDSLHARQIVSRARTQYPHLRLIVRSSDRLSYVELQQLGVDSVHRETFETAMLLAEDALQHLGVDFDEAERVAEAFRDHDERLLELALAEVMNAAFDGAPEAPESRSASSRKAAAAALLQTDTRLVTTHRRGREALAALLEAEQRDLERERAVQQEGD